MTSYLAGHGGVNTPDSRTANLCPHSMQHGVGGDCVEPVASLAALYKLPPGTRHMYSVDPAGGVVTRPYQWVYQENAFCVDGWAPYNAGEFKSCRPLATLGNPACQYHAGGSGRLYDYSH